MHKTPLEIRQKAVEELRLRQVSDVPISGIGEKYGVSDATIYNWAQSIDQKPKRKMSQPHPKSNPERVAAILKAWHARGPNDHVDPFLKKHGVARATMYKWLGDEAAKEKPAMEAPSEQRAKRREYPTAFKQEVVEQYTTRRAGVSASDIAERNGVTENIVHAWCTATRNGTLAPKPKANGAAQIVHVPEQTALALDSPQGELEQMSMTGLASMRLAQLEAQNKALRKIVVSLMDNANQSDLRRINLLLLEQL